MAKNKPTGDNSRKGFLKKRSQSYNPMTALFTKRNTVTGKFMGVKISGNRFKGVRGEK